MQQPVAGAALVLGRIVRIRGRLCFQCRVQEFSFYCPPAQRKQRWKQYLACDNGKRKWWATFGAALEESVPEKMARLTLLATARPRPPPPEPEPVEARIPRSLTCQSRPLSSAACMHDRSPIRPGMLPRHARPV